MEVTNIKNLLKKAAALILALSFCFTSVPSFAESDANIDNGGGGLKDGAEDNFWNSGNDGVRVTIVDASSGQPKSVSIDYSNNDQSGIVFHFGQVCKTQYLNGTPLTVNTGTYNYKKPAQALPTIISNGSWLTSDIEEIRSYFTDEQVIKSIAGYMGFDFDDLTSGDYKMMIEPIMYITYHGVKTAMTATEAALYNQLTGGDVNNNFGPLSHKNLPFALFLEENDLGYTAWTGATDMKVSDSDIISNLGVGIVSFKEKEEETEITASDYDYRIDTDVYTSVTVTGGEHTPDNPVTVKFYIKNKVYTVSNVVYPEDGSQLVWCKWHTPSTEQTVNIRVVVTGGASASKTSITANIVDLDKNPPPNPTAYDRNNSFTISSSVPMQAQKTSLSWSVWSCYWKAKWVWHSRWVWTGKRWVDRGKWVDEGEWKFRSRSYRASISATMEITPDDKNPTATGSVMKSGYGINQVVRASVSGNGEHTDVQNAVTYFPEFKYKTYWRLLETTSRGKMEFQENKYSTYNNRTHFTRVWYPDGTYKVYTWVMDCWTPAGMLSVNKTDSLTIKGNVYDDWHIAPTN